jgi:signal recognition particle subunit SRP54
MRLLVQNTVVKEITQMLTSENEPFQPVRNKHNVIMFVGLQGAGKTTTCMKYAAHYIEKGWRTALICADTFRAGAFD